ncbi:MAG TPA: 4-hydroxy-tetrahydrodipicolinate synthase [Halobacteriales archaeon]|uniref:4-hydroxy-tetrahydrodipicolinate synthase n=1 Tax=Candidatus Hikarchaeum yamanae TaxID=2675326 RepID=UPI0017DC7CAD|nr:4-hydroxy-tetrahydrodipicolinate synthase [Halobacteriales archaeon]|tara:strand:+ start:85987 stop:86895 length:909 start_codon:yes stop_codon:yes gene_type:complete
MTSLNLTGVFPAMTTPFFNDGSIDFNQLEHDAKRLESAGVDGLVPTGSTGESATLSHDEHVEVVECVVNAVKNIPIIAGTGSNSTSEAITLSKRSVDAGADGILLISPYYNKPEPAGMESHFLAIADAVEIPQVIYNVPSRTGRNIEIQTTISLASHDNIVGYKAASGDIGFISQVIESTRAENFNILSGDDEMTVPILCLGGTGVISVAANIAPELTCDMVWSTLPGERHNFSHALSLNRKLCPIFRGLFVESNPIPIKEAMHLKYDSSPHLRLPLSRISDDNRQQLLDLLGDLAELEHTI